MTALTAAVSASATILPVDTPVPTGDTEYPSYFSVESEVIVVLGRMHKTTWSVDRGVAGTTAAAHDSGTALTRYYPDAPASGGGGTNTYDGV